MQELLSTAIWLGVLQGAALAVVLWARSANRLANRILATLVAAVALLVLLGDFQRRWGFGAHPHLLGLAVPLPFLFGPLLYLYTVALTRPVVRFDPRWFAHATPFVADVLYMTQAFYMKSGDEKVALARATSTGIAPLSLSVVNTLEVVQAFIYLFLTWRALEHYGKKIHGYFSDVAGIDLRWLRGLVLAHGAVWSVVLVSVVLRWFGSTPSALRPLVPLGSSFVIFLTGWVSLWQPELAQKATAARVTEEDASVEGNVPAPAPAALTPAPSPPKYQRNRLDDAEAREIEAKLESLMEGKGLYRDAGLTLPTLADEIGVTPHMLSQVLNVRIGKNFFVFVNSYRAEALKAALADPSRSERGVLELAFEVGFSSKSTLNAAFKKLTGMTPTEFRGRARAPKIPENSRG
jgi:AraC-like DNA-binding protein